jgi:hypothetical protein
LDALALSDVRLVAHTESNLYNVVDINLNMNSPFLDAAHWDAEVAKMIKSFGAPIDPADAKTIGAYLKQNYGE